jgi:hypothetical protein
MSTPDAVFYIVSAFFLGMGAGIVLLNELTKR